MKPEIKALAEYRLTRAYETFREGEGLLEREQLPGALNRFYYAVFYAARALLATKELDSSKHSGIISLFQQHFVKTGLVGIEMARTLPHLFEKRRDADYEDFVCLSLTEVQTSKEESQRFIKECERVLQNIFCRGEQKGGE